MVYSIKLGIKMAIMLHRQQSDQSVSRQSQATNEYIKKLSERKNMKLHTYKCVCIIQIHLINLHKDVNTFFGIHCMIADIS